MGEHDRTPPLTKAARARSQAEADPLAADTWRLPSPGRPSTHMGDDERAMIGSESRKRARTSPVGVPVPPAIRPADEITRPIELLDRDLSQSEIEIIRRSKRDSGDPAVFEDIVKLTEALFKERSENRERDVAYDAVVRSPHEVAKQLHARLTVAESTLKTAKRLAIAAIISLAGGVGTFATGVLNRTEEHGGDKVRLEQFRRDIDRLDGELRDIRITLGRRSALDRAGVPALNVSTKGTVQ